MAGGYRIGRGRRTRGGEGWGGVGRGGVRRGRQKEKGFRDLSLIIGRGVTKWEYQESVIVCVSPTTRQ